jgi:transposase
LWHEYKVAFPDVYQYSWFCDQYRDWPGKLDVVMRQEHRAGETENFQILAHDKPHIY